ncbi:MAG: TCP-1/cpn60 chaperonin family protein [Firmicutes bacterium]|nr:TCP-1/cpn60 chaperonin family protein [Bacillota bacterium]
MTTVKQVSSSAEVDERLAALVTNAGAVQAIASSVEGTLGSKGLDAMLVDRFGDVVITNDGITILSKIETTHPAARMVIGIAKAQEEEVGDGTTTATIMAGTLLGEGVKQVMKGVPVARVLEGLRLGLERAEEALKAMSRPVGGPDDPLLAKVALIAGRGRRDIADLVVEAARMVGREKLLDRSFKLLNSVVAKVGAENEVFMGVLVDKERLNKQMPREVAPARVLVVDDALEPEELEEEALGTESGFKRYLELQREFRDNLAKLAAMGVNVVVVDRGVDDAAEEILTDAGVMVLRRVTSRELRQVAEHTGARPVKRTALRRDPADLERYLGRAERVYEDEKLEHVRFLGGVGKPMATVLVGAATEEVVDERERIAKDAAAAVQAAVRGGVVPGGGAAELAASRRVEEFRRSIRGLAGYGVECVVEALRRPLSQIVANAGFNPLEKVGDALAAQAESGCDALGVDLDTGEVVDMVEAGVVDPTQVKTHALRAAGEIAEAILRINTIIKKREEEGAKGGHAGGSSVGPGGGRPGGLSDGGR